MLVGLAVADLSLSMHRLIRAGRSIKWDWITPVLAFVTLCYILNLWWGFYFDYSKLESLQFGWFNIQLQHKMSATAMDMFTTNVPMGTMALASLLLIRFRYLWLHALMILVLIYTIATEWLFYTLV